MKEIGVFNLVQQIYSKHKYSDIHVIYLFFQFSLLLLVMLITYTTNQEFGVGKICTFLKS